MNTEITTQKDDQQKALTPLEIVKVLSSSLYPGAQRESITLVLDYCRAAGIDPMLKPVHIVPMYCATGEKDPKGYDKKAMRDVIMPGIGLYRIQAARTKQYAGINEPEYGEEITEGLGGASVTYPKWCKVTVKRQIAAGVIVEFSAIEYWKENYAVKNKDTTQPNAMWSRRPYGQINKCAEAQALRKAFPEIGSAPTADEMEGKEIDVTPPQEEKKDVATLDLYSDEDFSKNIPKWKELIANGKKTPKSLISFLSTKAILTEDQIEAINEWGNNENS